MGNRKVAVINSWIVLCTTAVLLWGCPPPVVKVKPPEPRMEFYGTAPYAEAVWIPGHWVHHRGEWVWISGYWARPPRPNARWVPGHWEPSGEGWAWKEGHWESR